MFMFKLFKLSPAFQEKRRFIFMLGNGVNGVGLPCKLKKDCGLKARGLCGETGSDQGLRTQKSESFSTARKTKDDLWNSEKKIKEVLKEWKNKYGRDDFTCPRCPWKKFSSIHSFRQHLMAKHSKQLDYGCDYCPRCFADEEARNSHMRKKHANELRKKNA